MTSSMRSLDSDLAQIYACGIQAYEYESIAKLTAADLATVDGYRGEVSINCGCSLLKLAAGEWLSRQAPKALKTILLAMLAGTATPQLASAQSQPPTQAALMKAVTDAKAQFDAAPNEMARGATRPARAQALCTVLPKGIVKDWVGKVKTLSSTSSGKGVLSINLGEGITFQTFNLEFADSFKTLIEPNSPLFARAVALAPGQNVIFSAQLMPFKDDCFREISMTVRGSMTEPDFIIRFSSLTPVP